MTEGKNLDKEREKGWENEKANDEEEKINWKKDSSLREDLRESLSTLELECDFDHH